MKAMILAAGSGKRMGTLTKHCPKPLLKYNNQALIDHQINALATAGFNDIVINVSYLAKQIIEHCGDGSRYGITITYSFEPVVGGLETGGGVYQALPLLGKKPFLVTSADIITDFPYAQLRQQSDKDCHLVFTPNPDHHPKGDFALTAKGLVSFEGERYNYAGIAVMHPRLFAGAAHGKIPLRDIFVPAIKTGIVSGQLYQGEWANIGTPDALLFTKTI